MKTELMGRLDMATGEGKVPTLKAHVTGMASYMLPALNDNRMTG